MRRLLIVGCGDIGMRLVPLVRGRYRLYALTRSRERQSLLRAAGVVPVTGDLDDPDSLVRLAGLPHYVVHLAPPPGAGTSDTRTRNLIRALKKARSIPQRLVYISTSGVYGDCRGAIVQEHRPMQPQSDRAARRADAERRLRRWGRSSRIAVVILRVPGIYASDRLPLARLQAGTPVPQAPDDPFTNHVHADDLAHIVQVALARGLPQRVYHACDGSWITMGEYFDMVAQAFGLAAPPRVSRGEAVSRIPEKLLSFMRESRRLANRRLRRELRIRLTYPSVAHGLAAALQGTGPSGPDRDHPAHVTGTGLA